MFGFVTEKLGPAPTKRAKAHGGSPPDQTAYGALMEMYRNMELVQGVPEDLGLQYFDKDNAIY